MAIKSDDFDIRPAYLQTHLGGNGDYYISILEGKPDGRREMNSVRICMSGGFSKDHLDIRLLIVDLYRKMEAAGLNNHPDDDEINKPKP